MTFNPDVNRAFQEVRDELDTAMSRFGPMASAHEGLAVLWEEFEELKVEVFKSPKKRDIHAMHAEAVQCAAMALRFIVDVTLPALREADEA